MQYVVPALLGFLVLSFLVLIHELGHYLVAKWRKVHVEEFGLGYPPRAAKLFHHGSTLFSLNWIPFGGFVKMEGEDGPEEEDTTDEKKSEKVVAASHAGDAPFYKKGKLSRLAIILAGPLVNFLFAILAFSFYFSVKGIPTLAPNPRVGEVAHGSPAEQSKIPTGVDITGFQLNDAVVYTHTVDEVKDFVAKHQGEHVTVITTGKCQDTQCEQQEQKFDVYLRTSDELAELAKQPNAVPQGSMGVEFAPVILFQFYPWYEMPVRGAIFGTQQALAMSQLIMQSLGDLVTQASHGKVPNELSGPLGGLTQAYDLGFLTNGLLELLNFAGMLSLNLAIMNVLPIPALDGGRAFFILLEYVIGKKNVQKFEGYANYGGMAFLLSLMVLITIKDIGNLIFRVMGK